MPDRADAGEADELTGTIQGTVVYQADSSRPWRFARYYIKNSAKGLLAEAVVALRGKGLNDQADKNPAQTHTIDQKNFQFVPETIAIRVGDSVTFRNSDPETHNVKTTGTLANFNANTFRGADYTHLFDRAGGIGRPVVIGCVYHGSMRAWVFVFDHPHFQVTGADGRFRFEHVPAGEYFLELTHPAGELRWRKRIELAAGKTLNIDVQLSPDDQAGR